MSHSFHENRPEEKTVLVVEDDASIGELVVMVLTMETPYQVLCVQDAFQALEIMKKRVPDLLVLDYQLPKMNGLELYDHVHAQEAFRTVPALFMSANAPKEALEQRSLCSLSKPFEVDTLVQAIEERLAS